MSEQLDLETFTGAHPTNREFVARLAAWGFTQRRADGIHLVFRAPRGGTLRVLRSLLGRADAALVAKAARLAGIDVARFWAGPPETDDVEGDVEGDDAEAGMPAQLRARRVSATRDRIIALVLGVHTTADRPLGFDQVVALCRNDITRDQARTASAVLCRDGQLHRIRSGVYQWADGARAHRPATDPATEPVNDPAPPAPTRLAAAPTPVPPAPPARPGSAELFERLFPRGVRMTAELLADFEQWAALTEKLTAYADAS